MTDYAAARVAMVDNQIRTADVTSYALLDALLDVPRERFAPVGLKPVAYLGEHLPLGPGRVILDPRTFAKMLEAADVGPDDLVLDVACGLGYSTAVLARLAAAVIAVESDPDMARAASGALTELEVHNAEVMEGPLAAGGADHAPYNVIIVNGGVEEIPEGLTDQLREGGRLVAIRMTAPSCGRCEVTTLSGGVLSSWWAFDATAPVLDGFARAPAFEF